MNDGQVLRSITRRCNRPGRMPQVSGHGIVTTGCERYMDYLVRMADSLRTAGSTMPVQLVFRKGEFSDQSLTRFSEDPVFSGWELVDMTVAIPETANYSGFKLKPFAIMACTFAECLYIDSDNMLLVRPERIFEEPGYKTTGFLLWPDLKDSLYLCQKVGKLRQKLWVADLFTPIEAGQMVIDKSRHWRTLWNASILNTESDYIYEYCYGDKDTFPIAAEMARLPYSISFKVPTYEQVPGRFPHLAHYLCDKKTKCFLHHAGGDTKWPNEFEGVDNQHSRIP
jgi:hypothetical protein